MARGRKTNKIVPFTKTVPTEGLDKVPETAGLDDYDKMIAKLANSSDDIIDGALDKLEGRKQIQLKSPIQTNLQEKPVASNVDEKFEETNVQNNLDAANERINCLNLLVEKLQSENQELKKASHPSVQIESKTSIFKDEIEKLTTKNDDLILRNSELEFEISRLGSENQRLKQQLENIMNSRNLPPQTYTADGYTRPPYSSRGINNPRIGKSPVMGMNGYESWN